MIIEDVPYIVGMGIDITKRIEVENMLKEYTGNLEDMVEERTRQLHDAQAQLIHKEKLSIIGKLAGIISHELRNPLGVIGNSTYFLNMKLNNVDDKVKKHINILQKEVKRATRLISELLEYSKIKVPRYLMSNINKIIKIVMDDLDIPENLFVSLNLNESIPSIMVDPESIKRVIFNILINAIQAMLNGGKLEIITQLSQNNIEILVTDTGIGIPKSNLKKIFKPLFSTKINGIGLGLSIARDIINSHNGIIEVESEENEGSKFLIKIPIKNR
jgi:signal transduction histidine kinase